MADRMNDAGIAWPRTRLWVPSEGLPGPHGLLSDLPFPLMIKSRYSCRGDLVARVNSVEELLAVETLSEPWKVGSRYFYLKRTANQQQPVIMMREWKNGKEIALIDPTDRDPTGTTAVGILDISRDATLLAYSVRKGG